MLMFVIQFVLKVLFLLLFLCFPFGILLMVENDNKTELTVSTPTKIFGVLGTLYFLWITIDVLIPCMF